MRIIRVVILCILLAVLATVVKVKVMPHLIPRRTPEEPKRVEQPAELSRAPRLMDGSFNPIPPVKAAPSDDPSSLVARTRWRERYLPYLKQTQPAETAPAIYVYPFLDRTPDGVGLECTYGWRLVGAAALAQWTDARIAEPDEPQNYGLPRYDGTDPGRQLTLEEWMRQAQGDRATANARYIITGVYDYDARGKKHAFRMVLIDRQAPAAIRELAASTSPERGDYVQLAVAQRAMARAMADRLIDLGLVHARPEPKTGGLDLDQELGQVARLLDAGDSWAVMDGIDRALALALLFPRETLPLQAAAYGLNALEWSTMIYADNNVYQVEMASRVFALAQIALAMNPAPLMSRLNWAKSCVDLGYSYRLCLEPSLADARNENITRELFNYRNIIIWNHYPKLSAEEMAKLPDWQNLWTEFAASWFIRDGGDRTFYHQCLQHWKSHDLYLQALINGFIRKYRDDYRGQRMDLLPSVEYAAAYATIGTMAAEMAATLTALGPGAEADSLVGLVDDIYRMIAGDTDAGVGPFSKGPKLNRERIESMIKAEDYYGLRQLFIQVFTLWGIPDGDGHPVYEILTAMETVLPKVMQDPYARARLTEYADFEFSPARRAQYFGWRDVLGPYLIAKQNANYLGVYEAFREIAMSYLGARPSNAAGQDNFMGLYQSQPNEPGADEAAERCMMDQCVHYPLDPAALFELGNRLCEAESQTQGLAFVKAYARAVPFVVSRNLKLGRFYRDQALHAKAAKYLAEFLKDYPDRYDIANERAWSLCEMGRWMDPEVRSTFARPVPLLSGNHSFHRANLEYLIYWAKDYAAARKAADYFLQWATDDPMGPSFWMADIEKADGNTTKALEILQNINVPNSDDPLKRANNYTRMANAYLNLDRPDLAEPFVRKAAQADSWKGDVIIVMGRLAFAKGEYAKALNEYVRELDRYGFNPDTLDRICLCFEKQNQRDRAIDMLEAKLLEDPRIRYIELRIHLMRLYEESGQSGKIEPLMDEILKSPHRARYYILEAVKYYKKVQPQKAVDIEKRINEIMAGPED
ncbi:MAG: hypothetical protein M1457_04870 [bacterium]|nr:hypothetical protein [bacterium]